MSEILYSVDKKTIKKTDGRNELWTEEPLLVFQ